MNEICSAKLIDGLECERGHQSKRQGPNESTQQPTDNASKDLETRVVPPEHYTPQSALYSTAGTPGCLEQNTELDVNTVDVTARPFPQSLDLGGIETLLTIRFLEKAAVALPCFDIFPNLAHEVCGLAKRHCGLYYAILSASCLIDASIFQQWPNASVDYQTKAFAFLRHSLSANEFTEQLVISVSLLAWTNITLFNPDQSRNLLQTLSDLFGSIRDPSPLLMQVFRFSIRLDILASIFFFPSPPVFFSRPSGDDREWILKSLINPNDPECILAALSLDDLTQRSCHLASESYTLRRTRNDAEAYILFSTQSLSADHGQWPGGESIKHLDMFESCDDNILDGVSDRLPTMSFVHDTGQTYVLFWEKLLRTWQAIYIFIDLISTPDSESAGSSCKAKAEDMYRRYREMAPNPVSQGHELLNIFFTGLALERHEDLQKRDWLSEHILGPSKAVFPFNQWAVVYDPRLRCIKI